MESERPPPLGFRNKEHPEEPFPNRITGRRSEKQLVQKKRGESIGSTPDLCLPRADRPCGLGSSEFCRKETRFSWSNSHLLRFRCKHFISHNTFSTLHKMNISACAGWETQTVVQVSP